MLPRSSEITTPAETVRNNFYPLRSSRIIFAAGDKLSEPTIATPAGTRIKLIESISREDLVGAISPDSLTHLWVAVDVGWTWGWLSMFPNLEALTLEMSLVSVDLTSLADVRLREIRDLD